MENKLFTIKTILLKKIMCLKAEFYILDNFFPQIGLNLDKNCIWPNCNSYTKFQKVQEY